MFNEKHPNNSSFAESSAQVNPEQNEQNKKFEYPLGDADRKELREMSEIRELTGGDTESDMDCIVEILGGTQGLTDEYEFERGDQPNPKQEDAHTMDSALKYLTKQGSVEALKVAARKVENLPSELQYFINSN